MWENWNLFRGLDALHREIDRIFEGAWPDEDSLFRTAFLPGLSAHTYPKVNLYENPEAVVVEALAPGLDTDSLEVTVKGNTLTFAGEKMHNADVKPEAYHRNERATGRFIRTVDLGAEINEAEVSASYEDGILTITLPKAEHAKPKRIPIQMK